MPRPLTKPAGDFVTRALFSGLNAGAPMPLDLALRDLVASHQMEHVAFHRLGSFGGRLSIKAPETYRILTAVTNGLTARDEIDDAIYDDFASQLTALKGAAP